MCLLCHWHCSSHFCHDYLIPHDNHLLRYCYYIHFAGVKNWGTENLSNMLKVLQLVKNRIRTDTQTVWNQVRAMIISWTAAAEPGLETNFLYLCSVCYASTMSHPRSLSSAQIRTFLSGAEETWDLINLSSTSLKRPQGYLWVLFYFWLINFPPGQDTTSLRLLNLYNNNIMLMEIISLFVVPQKPSGRFTWQLLWDVMVDLKA